MSGEEPEWMSWTLEDLNLHQPQRQVEKPIATPVVIIDDDSDDDSGSYAFESCEEDERLDVVVAVHKDLAWEVEEAEQQALLTEECMLWSAGLQYWKHEDPRTIDEMKTKAENLTEDDRREFDDWLCGYMIQHELFTGFQTLTPLLYPDVSLEKSELQSEAIFQLHKFTKCQPESLFAAMKFERDAFLTAYGAWEQRRRRSAKKTYVPKTKRAKHNGSSFISDVANEDQMDQSPRDVTAVTAEEHAMKWFQEREGLLNELAILGQIDGRDWAPIVYEAFIAFVRKDPPSALCGGFPAHEDWELFAATRSANIALRDSKIKRMFPDQDQQSILSAKLRWAGLIAEKNSGDGDCFYLSLISALQDIRGRRYSVKQIRYCVATFLWENSKVYIDEEGSCGVRATLMRYFTEDQWRNKCAVIRGKKEWACESVILACSVLYDVNIHVWSNVGKDCIFSTPKVFKPKMSAETVHLAHYAEFHYEYARPVQFQ